MKIKNNRCTYHPDDKLYQSGATTVEYALVLAIVVALVISASGAMKQPLQTFYVSAVEQIAGWMAGGSVSSGPTTPESSSVGSRTPASRFPGSTVPNASVPGSSVPGARTENENSPDATTGTRESRRDTRSDRRVDRRIRTDERWRRESGGDDSGHLSNDWAGRSILERYLTGGGDWNIANDPRWTEYMQANSTLTNDLEQRAIETAGKLYQSGQNQATIDETFAMAVENGEGVVGYQYLHGTNGNVGGFKRDGVATVSANSSGGQTVRLDMSYTWNDVIDPNPQYATDQWKNTIAETITLGQADPYEIHITWSETTIVELDANGKPVSIRNE